MPVGLAAEGARGRGVFRKAMRKLLLALSCLAVPTAFASDVFTRSALPVTSSDLSLTWVQSYETFRVDAESLTQALINVPLQNPGLQKFGVINLPTPSGRLAPFKIVESPVMAPALAKRVAVKTYKVVGIEDKYASGRVDWGINGFHGIITTPSGSYTIDPPKTGNRGVVVVYFFKDDFTPKTGIPCLTRTTGLDHHLNKEILRATAPLAGTTLKTVRMAVNANGEYTRFYGSEAAAEAGVVTTVNRVNQIYNTDASIHLNLTYIKAWPDPATDPFTNGDHGAMINENQDELDTTVGNANYDIGHIFSTTFGGLAALNSVGRNGLKALGSSGLETPVGSLFDTWIVAHETGHQWGSPHTFANCGGGFENAVEPGSGSTILSYAGICAAAFNVQSQPDPYYHGFSLVEIQEWRTNPQSGGTETPTGNSIPVVSAGADLTVPRNTPFKLRATATDANASDVMTYCWEQFDFGANALYRSLPPAVSATRFFPKLATVLAGGTDTWEPRVTTDKTLTFRVTVRDNHAGGGGTAQDEMTLTVAGDPFTVTAPAGAQSWLGGAQQTVTWTNTGPATHVNILFSEDGGTSYGAGTATVLVANTPNDGTQTIFVPQVGTTTGRIIVEAVDQAYYNVNSGNITVTPTRIPILTDFTVASPTVVGGTAFQGTLTLDYSGGGPQDVAISSDKPAIVPAATVTIPANRLTRTFSANTAAVTSDQTVVVSAKHRAVTKTQTIEVTREVGPALLTVNPRVIAGSARAIGTVRLTHPAPIGGVVVSMTDNGPELAVNPNVIVASGHITQNFTITTYAVNASVVRTVTASRAGRTATFDVTIVPLTIASFTIAPSGVVGGNSATGTVTLNAPAPPSGVTVSLAANSTVLQVPATLTIPEGSISGTFPVTTSTTSVQVTRTVSMTFKGQKMTRNLVILPADIASISVAPSTVKGGLSATATIKLNGNAGSSFVVNASSNGPEVIVPATVTVPYGKYEWTFTVRTTAVTSGRTRIITISRNGRTRTCAIVVTK